MSMDNSTRSAAAAPPPRLVNRADPASAANSLQVLLREDPLLKRLGLTDSSNSTEQVAFAYASTLLQTDDETDVLSSGGSNLQEKANLALQDVERKLILVESLAVKLSRNSPESVAGHFLQLHGHSVADEDTSNSNNDVSSSTGEVTTLQAMSDRADRLQKQSETLETVARRVESSLSRGLTRMDTACQKLERVLLLSSTLKKILRLQFENEKLQNYDLEDLRDLTRAAASVAILEELLKDISGDEPIQVVEQLRPEAQATAQAVRQAAANLLLQSNLQQLGATLQVYYHLGELSDAVWKAVNDAHAKAQSACRQLWNPVTIAGIQEQAKKASKGDSKSLPRKLQEARALAAQEWASGMVEASLQVRQLQTVLSRKTDPIRRQGFWEVVAQSPIPPEYQASKSGKFSLFSLFWGRLSRTLASSIQHALNYEKGKFKADVAALYPTVRASSIELIGRIEENPSSTMSRSVADADDLRSGASGIMGGTMALEDNLFFQTPRNGKTIAADTTDNPQAGISADSWTQPKTLMASSSRSSTNTVSNVSTSAVFQSSEWKEVQGNGLGGLEQAFVESCRNRLREPLQYMFPEHVAVDEDGVAVAGAATTVLLPSKYDVQRFDQVIRQELSLADPREGGGEYSAIGMIAECVVETIVDFSLRAKSALTGVGEHGYLANNTFAMTENLQHDRKVAAILYTLANFLREAPQKTFVAPYQPSSLPQHDAAAKMCQKALVPAIDSIDKMVKSTILNPLCRALNRQINTLLAKIHLGAYLDGSAHDSGGQSFVQTNLSSVFESVAKSFLVKFPPPYSWIIASTIATYTIDAYISNICLIRPLGESARLQMTQDLADLELALEQFLGKTSGGVGQPLNVIGRAYSELRAVRQMLFWTGLEESGRSATELAKAIWREPWRKDVRPSTLYHYLFSFAPPLLSSPHHHKRVKADVYVSTVLVPYSETAEDEALITTVTCCDEYQQRATSSTSSGEGDPRIAALVLLLVQEMGRQRRL